MRDSGHVVLDHVVPRSRGGKDAWENLVWSSKAVNAKKGNRLPHEAGLKLLSIPRAPKELPVSALIRNAHGNPEWKLFVENEATGGPAINRLSQNELVQVLTRA